MQQLQTPNKTVQTQKPPSKQPSGDILDDAIDEIQAAIRAYENEMNSDKEK